SYVACPTAAVLPRPLSQAADLPLRKGVRQRVGLGAGALWGLRPGEEAPKNLLKELVKNVRMTYRKVYKSSMYSQMNDPKENTLLELLPVSRNGTIKQLATSKEILLVTAPGYIQN
ncbi:hypothetical protein H1C71_017141, partial [Ictidomys tridecemlineatus]